MALAYLDKSEMDVISTNMKMPGMSRQDVPNFLPMRLRQILTTTWLNSWFWMVWRAPAPGEGRSSGFRREPRRGRRRERGLPPPEYSRSLCQSPVRARQR